MAAWKASRRALAVTVLSGLATALLVVALGLVGNTRRNIPVSMLSKANPLLKAPVKSKADVERIIKEANAFAEKQQSNTNTLLGKPAVPLAGMKVPGADHSSQLVSTEDMDAFFESPFFSFLSQTCCFTLYFPPDTEDKLPLSWEVNGAKAQRLRDFVGRRNGLMFNGANGHTAAFINQYFSTSLQELPIISGFAKRSRTLVMGDPSTASAIPEGFAALPPKLIVDDPHMTAVDTMSMPGGTVVVYNNFPRHPTGSPAFILRYCQVENPWEQDGPRITVAVKDCPQAAEEFGSECECGEVTYLGWKWGEASLSAWDTSTINAHHLAAYFASRHTAPPSRAAFVGGAASIHEDVAPTLVDRRPEGPPDHGMDPLRRDEIQEWEEQDQKWGFWAHNGGWRDVCGARAHPLWDPTRRQFYTDKLHGSSKFVRHWCGCYKNGWVETPTKMGVDTEGCAEMADHRPHMAKVSPRAQSAEWYYQLAPEYAYQRVLNRKDDRRYDERTPMFVQGNGGDEGVWLDENDAGPPPPINDYARDNSYVPVREEDETAEDRPYDAAIDDKEPPVPRVWSWEGVLSQDEARDWTRKAHDLPDNPLQGLPEVPVASEQDKIVEETDPEGEGYEGADGGLDGITG